MSYVRDDIQTIDHLAAELQAAGITVWLDREQIRPGQRWRDAIRDAIQTGAIFLACFSAAAIARERSYMNEELSLAIEELRLRSSDREWFIPVLIGPVQIPHRRIGSNETLRDLQWVDLTSDWQRGVRVIAEAAHRAAERQAESSRQSDRTVAVDRSVLIELHALAADIETALAVVDECRAFELHRDGASHECYELEQLVVPIEAALASATKACDSHRVREVILSLRKAVASASDASGHLFRMAYSKLRLRERDLMRLPDLRGQVATISKLLKRAEDELVEEQVGGDAAWRRDCVKVLRETRDLNDRWWRQVSAAYWQLQF